MISVHTTKMDISLSPFVLDTAGWCSALTMSSISAGEGSYVSSRLNSPSQCALKAPHKQQQSCSSTRLQHRLLLGLEASLEF